jgi:hypothetical protein
MFESEMGFGRGRFFGMVICRDYILSRELADISAEIHDMRYFGPIAAPQPHPIL